MAYTLVGNLVFGDVLHVCVRQFFGICLNKIEKECNKRLVKCEPHSRTEGFRIAEEVKQNKTVLIMNRNKVSIDHNSQLVNFGNKKAETVFFSIFLTINQKLLYQQRSYD